MTDDVAWKYSVVNSGLSKTLRVSLTFKLKRLALLNGEPLSLGRFTPYLERACLRSLTPEQSAHHVRCGNEHPGGL